jgi:hypothetical protein
MTSIWGGKKYSNGPGKLSSDPAEPGSGFAISIYGSGRDLRRLHHASCLRKQGTPTLIIYRKDMNGPPPDCH